MMCTSYIYLILKNKTHVPKLFDPILKNDAFAGSMPKKVAYKVFHNSRGYNFLTGNYRFKSVIFIIIRNPVRVCMPFSCLKLFTLFIFNYFCYNSNLCNDKGFPNA